jgi:hypothetical protein
MYPNFKMNRTDAQSFLGRSMRMIVQGRAFCGVYASLNLPGIPNGDNADCRAPPVLAWKSCH